MMNLLHMLDISGLLMNNSSLLFEQWITKLKNEKILGHDKFKRFISNKYNKLIKNLRLNQNDSASSSTESEDEFNDKTEIA